MTEEEAKELLEAYGDDCLAWHVASAMLEEAKDLATPCVCGHPHDRHYDTGRCNGGK
jgi:hypothetical protein